MKSAHAQAAAAIRSELKHRGIPGRVTSKSYSGGSSVDVYLTDIPPKVREEIEAFCADYQYGHFDGMTDCYHVSNRRDDLPQVRHLFVNNSPSAAMSQAIWHYIRNVLRYSGTESLPQSYAEAANAFLPEWNYRVCELVWQFFGGRREGFWDTIETVECVA